MAYVVLEGYEIRRETEKAFGLCKEGAGFQVDLVWVPKACCRDANTLSKGDTDLEVYQSVADEKELDY